MPPRPSGSTIRKRSASTSPGRKRTGPGPDPEARACDPDAPRVVRRAPPRLARGAVPGGVAGEPAALPHEQDDPSSGSGREQTVQLATALLQPELAGSELLQPVADLRGLLELERLGRLAHLLLQDLDLLVEVVHCPEALLRGLLDVGDR